MKDTYGKKTRKLLSISRFDATSRLSCSAGALGDVLIPWKFPRDGLAGRRKTRRRRRRRKPTATCDSGREAKEIPDGEKEIDGRVKVGERQEKDNRPAGINRAEKREE